VKHAFLIPALFALIGMNPGVSSATWEANHNYLGPSLGLAFQGSSAQLGFNFEHGMATKSLGVLGIGGVFRYWSYSEGYYAYGNWKYRNILIGAQSNYHFQLPGITALDPFAGLILAYDNGKVTWDGPGEYNWSTPSSGGLVLSASVGARYWIKPSMALTGRLGFGNLDFGALEVGLDFKL
jgi:hypothetical protein